jgi:hypothetical protein
MRILLALFLVVAAALPAGAETRLLEFEVRRGDAPIGTHKVAIRKAGERTDVEIEIDLAVRFAFLTVYRYTHRSRETWEGARLVGLDASTDDNGERTRVAARATDAGLAVDGSGGRYVAPASVAPTSYWRRDKLERTHLLDTQSGKLVAVANAALGTRAADVDGAPAPVDFYRVSGDLEAELGYAADGSWAALAFEARGARIDYRRVSALSQTGLANSTPAR